MGSYTVLETFKDGRLTEIFANLGYPATWKAGEKRILPDAVVKAVVTSGGLVTIADDDAKESALVEPGEPIFTDSEKIYADKHKKAKKVAVLFPEGFKDGTLTHELAAIGHPPEFGVGEIALLPESLIEKIKISGGLIETDREAINQFLPRQGKHVITIEEWKKQREQAKDRALLKEQAIIHNRKIVAEIEMLSGRVVNQTGKTKEATWQRINELHSLLK